MDDDEDDEGEEAEEAEAEVQLVTQTSDVVICSTRKLFEHFWPPKVFRRFRPPEAGSRPEDRQKTT